MVENLFYYYTFRKDNIRGTLVRCILCLLQHDIHGYYRITSAFLRRFVLECEYSAVVLELFYSVL